MSGLRPLIGCTKSRGRRTGGLGSEPEAEPAAEFGLDENDAWGIMRVIGHRPMTLLETKNSDWCGLGKQGPRLLHHSCAAVRAHAISRFVYFGPRRLHIFTEIYREGIPPGFLFWATPEDRRTAHMFEAPRTTQRQRDRALRQWLADRTRTFPR